MTVTSQLNQCAPSQCDLLTPTLVYYLSTWLRQKLCKTRAQKALPATWKLTFHLNNVDRYLLLPHSEDFKVCDNTLLIKIIEKGLNSGR